MDLHWTTLLILRFSYFLFLCKIYPLPPPVCVLCWPTPHHGHDGRCLMNKERQIWWTTSQVIWRMHRSLSRSEPSLTSLLQTLNTAAGSSRLLTKSIRNKLPTGCFYYPLEQVKTFIFDYDLISLYSVIGPAYSAVTHTKHSLTRNNQLSHLHSFLT